MPEPCLFCRIVRREVPAAIVAETEDCLAFRDITPRAPVHVLVIPKVHVATLNDAADAAQLGKLMLVATEVARAEGIAESGYRTVVNTGPAAGQTVFHIHLHLLGGRDMQWPPG